MIDLLWMFPALSAFVAAWLAIAVAIVHQIRDEYSGRR